MRAGNEKDKRAELFRRHEADEVKMRLMRIRDELEDLGKIRKANSLNTIIGNLEHWQNTKW